MRTQILRTIDQAIDHTQMLSARTGHSPARIRILIALYMVDSLRVTAIAEKTGISQQAVGKQLRELQEKKLVRIQTDTDDGRARSISLTIKGVRATKKIEEQWY
jgi:DNA-binding MarR family transcriptional regulator